MNGDTGGQVTLQEVVALVLGAALSLVLRYWPGAAAWFAKLTADEKRLFVIAASVVLGLVWVLLGMLGLVPAVSLAEFINYTMVLLISSQAVHQVTPQPGPGGEEYGFGGDGDG